MRCARCGFCRAWCPVFEVKRRESWNARGRIMLIRTAQKEGLTTDVVQRIYSCTLCKACEVSCPPRIRVADVVEAARRTLVDSGIAPPPEQKPLVDAVISSGNMFAESTPVELQRAFSGLPDRSSNLLFMGCVAAHRYFSHTFAFMKILQEADVQFTVMKQGEICCGGFLKMIGLTKEFKQVASRNMELFEEAGVERVFTQCPMCYTTLKQLCGRGSVEILHSTQVLSDLLDSGRLELIRPVERSLTYHDPCHLGRHSNIYVQPRKLIETMPKTTLVEMEKTRSSSRCCGGPIRIPFTDIRNAMCEFIFIDCSNTGAEMIVTACPTCFHNLYAITPGVKVLDLAELVAYSMKLKDAPL